MFRLQKSFLSYGVSYGLSCILFFVSVGSFVTQPGFREVAAAGLASSHNLSLPGAFGSEGTQWEFIASEDIDDVISRSYTVVCAKILLSI